MQRLKQLFGGEDRAVSPVIGVILMVAITVILAAVIASFVLGLGDSAAEPSPSPTIDSEASGDTLNFSITGGDDFDATVTTFQYELTVVNESDSNSTTISGEMPQDEATSMTDGGLNTELTIRGIDADEATAGNEFSVDASSAMLNSSQSVDTISEWEVQLIWNPADQDSDTIYSDSNS